MKKVLILVFSLFLSGCEDNLETITTNPVTPEQKQTEIDRLKETVFALQGTIAQLDAFVASDFTNCDTGLPPFETKICQIAQTANAEQQVIYAGQVQQVIKMFQTELYGENCTEAVEVGCPTTSSITYKIDQIDISGLESDIAQLQIDVTQLQNDLSAIEGRLDDFDGSGNSIEVVIAGLESDISALDGRISDIENTINNGDIYKTIFICSDVPSSGPVNEPALIRGDNTEIRAYFNTGTKNGMGVLATAGVTGDVYSETESNTRNCKFKVYDLITIVKMCWNNADRKATESSIDTVCDSANSFTNPTADCTCVN